MIRFLYSQEIFAYGISKILPSSEVIQARGVFLLTLFTLGGHMPPLVKIAPEQKVGPLALIIIYLFMVVS